MWITWCRSLYVDRVWFEYWRSLHTFTRCKKEKRVSYVRSYKLHLNSFVKFVILVDKFKELLSFSQLFSADMAGVHQNKFDYYHHPIRILLNNLQRHDAAGKARRGKNN